MWKASKLRLNEIKSKKIGRRKIKIFFRLVKIQDWS